jgi:hypothetical protein
MRLLSAILLLALTSCGAGRADDGGAADDTAIEETTNLTQSELSMDQKEEIRVALRALLGRKNLDSFVIINETSSDKYVQFAVNDGQLYFDMPTQQFDEDQLTKVIAQLEPYGILLEVQKMYDAEDATNVIDEMAGFSKEIGNDLDVAMKIVEGLITKVFNPSGDINISLDEN